MELLNGGGRNGAPKKTEIPEAQRVELRCPCGCSILTACTTSQFFTDRLAPTSWQQTPPAPAWKCLDCGRLLVLTLEGFRFMKGKEASE